MALNPMVIGAGLGAATSLLGGSKQAGVTRTVQDLPDWLKPRVTRNLDLAEGYRDRLAGTGTPLLDSSRDEMLRILGGAYLRPESNPALKQYGDAIADTIGSRVDSRFALANRTGSFAHADALSRSIGESILPLYSGAYENERGRMYGSSVAAPGVVGEGVRAEFQPFVSYSSLFPNLTVTEQPFYRNRLGEAASGALTGAGIARMFGGNDRRDPLENAGMGDLLPLWHVA